MLSMNIDNIPLEDWFETQLAQERDGWLWTVYLRTVPSFTFPSGIDTQITVNPWASNMQVVSIDEIDTVNKTVNVSDITINSGAGDTYAQSTHTIWSIVRISATFSQWEAVKDAVNSKIDWLEQPIYFYANTAARDAALWATPATDWLFVGTTADQQLFYSAGGTRNPLSAGSSVVANASETVAGKVEISTQVEFDAGTATGWTWAPVVATNDQIRKQINTATAKTTPVNADSIGIADSAASWVIKKTTLTQLKAASDMQATTTTSWFVEMATDAEALAGTDETRYINSKQLNDVVDAWLATINVRTRLVKATTTQRTSTTTMTSDPDLTFSMAANTKYTIRAFIIFEANAAPDIKIWYTWPTSPTLWKIQRTHVIPWSPTGQVYWVDDINTVTTIACTTGSYWFVNFTAVVHNWSNAWTFAFQWAQNTNDVAVTQVLAGSYMEYIAY